MPEHQQARAGEQDLSLSFAQAEDRAREPCLGDGHQLPRGPVQTTGASSLRRQKRFETRARAARLRHSACVEDVDYHSARGLDRALFLKLAACDWINERRNLLITGASGLGKSWLACALGQKACRQDISVLYYRVPELFTDLAIAHGDGRYARLLHTISRAKLLILDDWGPETLAPD